LVVYATLLNALLSWMICGVEFWIIGEMTIGLGCYILPRLIMNGCWVITLLFKLLVWGCGKVDIKFTFWFWDPTKVFDILSNPPTLFIQAKVLGISPWLYKLAYYFKEAKAC